MFKRIIAVFLLAMTVFSARSQAPDMMSYQAVIRNVSNNLVVNKTVGVKISILKGGVNGTPVYVESHSVRTNANGMVSLYIGNGDVSQGAFSSIDWASGLFFIKTETDPDGGSNYTISGTSQLLSVPYALYAKSAGNSFDGDYNKLTNAPLLSQVATTGSYNDLTDLPEKQQLSINGNTISLTDGGSIQLPVSFDGDFNNLVNRPEFKTVATTGKYSDLTGIPEKQTLSIKDGSLVISGGEYLAIDPEFFKLPEGQVLSVANGKLAWIEPSYANISVSTYKVGDIYYNRSGMPEGVVIEVSSVGRYGKIISLKEIENKVWRTEHESVDVTNDTDGAENMSMIKRLLDWSTKYPAFASVAGEGEQWYLPAKNEWTTIFENKDQINSQLSIAGGRPLNGNFYWSSTESFRENDDNERAYATGIAMNNYTITQEGKNPIQVLAGDIFDDDKKVEGMVRGIRRLSWSEMTSKPVAGETYAVGDLYYKEGDKENAIGVVYAVTDGGQHGKVISLDETSLAWSTENVSVGATDIDDGAMNSASIVKIEGNGAKYPANAWCVAKGQGWYMPSVNEMIAINGVSFLLNVTLQEKGTPIEAGGRYWTSTEVDADNSYVFVNSLEPSSSNVVKTESAKVRAVYAF